MFFQHLEAGVGILRLKLDATALFMLMIIVWPRYGDAS
jgi:hypothetical protein